MARFYGYPASHYVKTIDPARRTPVIPGVVEISQTTMGLKRKKRKYSPNPYSHWWSFLLGLGAGFLVFYPLGQEMIKYAAGITEEEIRRRMRK